MSVDFALVWAGILAFAILAYVVLDGFDLGVGMLFPFFRDPHDRDRMMNSIAPVWDGNETWLVLGGGGLFAAFPLAYAVVMPALYIPLTAMLIGLIFRGVAFEFRARAREPVNFYGTGPSRPARPSRPSRRASCSAVSCKASPSPDAPTAAGRGIGSRPSAC